MRRFDIMRAKFLSYCEEVGIRYAIQWGKYEHLTLTVIELWLKSSKYNICEQEIKRHYNSERTVRSYN